MAKKNQETTVQEKLVSLCKRRGLIFQSSEIYGGLNSIWDYGPLGIELKNNIQNLWWEAMVRRHENIVGMDAAILMHPDIWKASGHVDTFTDPLVDCKECKNRFRADTLEGDRCPLCGGELTEPRNFNLMFKTFMGAVEGEASVIYLRPETAPGIYVNYQNVMASSRLKLPFGIAQVGKAFRNEITPGNFIFRTREFEQMEMQFFVRPDEDEKWFHYWREQRMQYYLDLGIPAAKLRFHKHQGNELAHYAKAAYDIEYQFSFGWQELEGIHNRTNFDLSRHQEHSGKNLEYFDETTRERFLPYVIETSSGLNRSLLMFLDNAYTEEEVKGEKRVVLKLHPRVAPIKAAVFPLVKKDGLPEIARGIVEKLMPRWNVFYDQQGAIGRRYRRMDEVGTPFCITVDYETKEDQAVTIRDRDSLEQVRVPLAEVESWLAERLR
jgi:glycyl-tRNA synthetase